MSFKFNVFSGTLDIAGLSISTANGKYVLKSGDTMTGPLIINPSSGNTALTIEANQYIKAGKRLYFDGN
jgi:hypothetical protein